MLVTNEGLSEAIKEEVLHCAGHLDSFVDSSDLSVNAAVAWAGHFDTDVDSVD
jgi:hypothetical protein